MSGTDRGSTRLRTEFSDTVASADTAARTVTLVGGAVLRSVAGTEVERIEVVFHIGT